MLIARDGSWFHDGKPIRRKAMVQLFSSILMLDTDELYYLVTPVEKVRLKVEDCPFVANQMEITGSGESQLIQFTTNVDEVIQVDEEHPIRVEVDGSSGEPHPTVHVRNGLNALINRAVFYRLIEHAEQAEEGDEIVSRVWSGNRYFELGRYTNTV